MEQLSSTNSPQNQFADLDTMMRAYVLARRAEKGGSEQLSETLRAKIMQRIEGQERTYHQHLTDAYQAANWRVVGSLAGAVVGGVISYLFPGPGTIGGGLIIAAMGREIGDAAAEATMLSAMRGATSSLWSRTTASGVSEPQRHVTDQRAAE